MAARNKSSLFKGRSARACPRHQGGCDERGRAASDRQRGPRPRHQDGAAEGTEARQGRADAEAKAAAPAPKKKAAKKGRLKTELCCRETVRGFRPIGAALEPPHIRSLRGRGCTGPRRGINGKVELRPAFFHVPASPTAPEIHKNTFLLY